MDENEQQGASGSGLDFSLNIRTSIASPCATGESIVQLGRGPAVESLLEAGGVVSTQSRSRCNASSFFPAQAPSIVVLSRTKLVQCQLSAQAAVSRHVELEVVVRKCPVPGSGRGPMEPQRRSFTAYNPCPISSLISLRRQDDQAIDDGICCCGRSSCEHHRCSNVWCEPSLLSQDGVGRQDSSFRPL